ncbi:MAG: hypothetical protein U0Q18_11240 [Bryobacteraceae bacterium]
MRVVREIGHRVSVPLREMGSFAQLAAAIEIEEEETPFHTGPAPVTVDPVAQTSAANVFTAQPLLNVAGMGSGFVGPQGAFSIGIPPPDSTAAVGTTQVVQTVNSAISVFDKSTGAILSGPITITGLWAGLSGPCASLSQTHDPKLLFDRQAGRWVVQIVTLGNPYLTCMAVSTSSDATGTYNVYAFQTQAVGLYSGRFMSAWPDAYYLSALTYTDPATYIGPSACAVDRQQMLAGKAATMQCFQVQDRTITGMLPADLDGSNAPPAGSPGYFLIQGPAGKNALYLYRFHVDFATPANSIFTGPITLGVAPYTPGPDCGVPTVPQPGTNTLLDVNGNLLMPRVAYRNFPRANPPHESLLAAHAVTVTANGAARVGLRWYELRQPGSSPVVFQQGTYSPDGSSRWMGSIAMDKAGNIALGYSVSSSSVYPSIRYTGRAPADSLGKMQAEATMVSGAGSQTTSDRWGDYSSMSVDPVDDCTMWYTNQYVPSTGGYAWATRLFAFRFPSCK